MDRPQTRPVLSVVVGQWCDDDSSMPPSIAWSDWWSLIIWSGSGADQHNMEIYGWPTRCSARVGLFRSTYYKYHMFVGRPWHHLDSSRDDTPSSVAQRFTFSRGPAHTPVPFVYPSTVGNCSCSSVVPCIDYTLIPRFVKYTPTVNTQLPRQLHSCPPRVRVLFIDALDDDIASEKTNNPTAQRYTWHTPAHNPHSIIIDHSSVGQLLRLWITVNSTTCKCWQKHGMTIVITARRSAASDASHDNTD